MSRNALATPTLPPLSRANVEPVERTLFWLVWLLNVVVSRLTRRVWSDQDKVPRSGGVVFVVNHISNFDPIAVGQFLAFSGRWPRFLAKSSLFTVPVIGRLLTACGQIPVVRNSRDATAALTAAVQAVREGRALTVYPEGTITKDPDLWPMTGKTGAARIAFATGCPVVPIGQWGAQDVMYGKRIEFPRLLPRKTLRVRAGDPVDLDDLRSQPATAAVLTEATRRIMTAITAVVAELRQETPPPVPYDPRGQRPGGPL